MVYCKKEHCVYHCEYHIVSTAGVTPEVLAKYIENQGREDEGQTAKLFET